MSDSEEVLELEANEIKRIQDQKIVFFKRLETDAPMIDHLTSVEREELKNVLSNRTFQKASAYIYAEAMLIGPSLISTDLSTEFGRGKATQLQGKAQGMVRVFEGFFDMLVPEREEEDDGEGS